jgi:hypothetical protein
MREGMGETWWIFVRDEAAWIGVGESSSRRRTNDVISNDLSYDDLGFFVRRDLIADLFGRPLEVVIVAYCGGSIEG